MPGADAPHMDFAALVDPLKRTVAGPGEFVTFYPESTDNDLEGVLTDAAAETKLYGFLTRNTIDAGALSMAPDANDTEKALIIIFAASRILTARLSNLKSRARYKAGNVEAETEQAASVLTALLNQIDARKQQFFVDLRDGYLVNGPDGLVSTLGSASNRGMFGMADLYLTKSLGYYAAYGYGLGDPYFGLVM